MAEHGYFALARFSRATLEGVRDPPFERQTTKPLGVLAVEADQASAKGTMKSKCCCVRILKARIHKL